MIEKSVQKLRIRREEFSPNFADREEGVKGDESIKLSESNLSKKFNFYAYLR